jgi:TolB-like protein
MFEFGPFRLDVEHGVLRRDGVPQPLGSRALSILQALVEAEGRIVTKSALMAAAWPNTVVEEGNLSVQIAALRKLLGQAPDGSEWIVTVSRVGYRLGGGVPDYGNRDQPGRGESPVASGRPSVVVLPFTNLSRDAEQEYFADGITEDVIMALSRYRWFSVIARNTSFAYKGKAVDSREIARDLRVDYVLEGSVRKAVDRVRISAQLVDGASASPVWANHYDFDLVDMLAVQDLISEQVVGAIEPAILKTEGDHSARVSTDRDLTGWDLVRRGMWFFHQLRRDAHWRARELFREACRDHPDFPDAHAWLARVSAGMAAYDWSDDREADLREGIEAAVRAISLDGNNPYAHYGLAVTSVHAGDLARGVRAVERAIELSPSFALGHIILGMAMLFSGRPADAIEPLSHGFRLNPFDPQNFVWYNTQALALFCAGRIEEALQWTIKAAQLRPTWRPTYIKMACCYIALGQPDLARACLAQPELEDSLADGLGPFRRLQPQRVAQMNALLHGAGLAERI